MKRFLLLLLCAGGMFQLSETKVVTAKASGLWKQTATWGGTLPANGDTVVIAAGLMVTIDSSVIMNMLTVKPGAELNFDSSSGRTITIVNDLTVEGAGAIMPSPAFTSGNSNNTINVGRNLAVNGIIHDTLSGSVSGKRVISAINMNSNGPAGTSTISGTGAIRSGYLIISRKNTTDTVVVKSGPVIETQILYLQKGVLNNIANNVTATTVQREIEPSVCLAPPHFRPGKRIVMYPGTTNITAALELPDTVSLLFASGASKEVALTKYVLVDSQLTLSNGAHLLTNDNILRVNGAVSGNGYVDGILEKPVTGNADTVRLFEVGSAAGRSPARVRLFGPQSKGTIAVRVYESTHKAAPVPAKTLGRFWTFPSKLPVTADSFQVTLTYTAKDFGLGLSEAVHEPTLTAALFQQATGTFVTLPVLSRDTAGAGGSITVRGITSLNDLILMSGSIPLAVDAPALSVPHRFALRQNFPNPFNPSTTIRFSVEQTGPASLTVVDVIGREVARLAEGDLSAGTVHERRFDGSGLSSGVYYAKLISNGRMQVMKMLLMK